MQKCGKGIQTFPQPGPISPVPAAESPQQDAATTRPDCSLRVPEHAFRCLMLRRHFFTMSLNVWVDYKICINDTNCTRL